MSLIVLGIPVTTDLTLKETRRIVRELVQDWAWEGRQLGKVELIRDGQFVHVCSYEKPTVTAISLNNVKGA
jgi:hypothetical protein